MFVMMHATDGGVSAAGYCGRAGHLVGSPPASSRVRVREVMLPQQILPIVIPVGRPHDTMNVLLGRLFGISRKLRQIRWTLVVEFNQNYGALNAIIKGAVGLHAADPGEP